MCGPAERPVHGRLPENALSVMGQELMAETEQGRVGSLGLTRSGIEPKGF